VYLILFLIKIYKLPGQKLKLHHVDFPPKNYIGYNKNFDWSPDENLMNQLMLELAISKPA
jgi:hypothetical protein